MNQEIFNLSNNLHRVLSDNWAVERRCVPSKEILDKSIKIISSNVGNLVINSFIIDTYKLIFQIIVQTHNYELNNTLPSEDELMLIIDTFKYVIDLNGRNDAILDSEDLWVLCLLFNIISYQKDKGAYMLKFKSWRE